jgi:hypothetical protein
MKRRSCPHPQPLSQAWERGARAEGSGGVRANHTLNQQRLNSDAPISFSTIRRIWSEYLE